MMHSAFKTIFQPQSLWTPYKAVYEVVKCYNGKTSVCTVLSATRTVKAISKLRSQLGAIKGELYCCAWKTKRP